MTFNTYKYRLEFKDAQDRTHLVDIFPDNWAGAQTAVDGAENPLIYNFGQDGDSIFRAINPTDIEINLVVSDSTIYDDIKGSEEGDWGVTWDIENTPGGGVYSEVWRGYILPDQMTMPFDPPAAFTLRAVCGLTLLKDEHWSPASEARQDIIVGIADALGEISGTSYQIMAAADWHASGGSGNSYAEYEFDPKIFKDTERRRPSAAEDWAKTGTVLSQLVGRFAGKLFMAGGRWRLIQREEVTGSTYQTDLYDTSGVDTAVNESVSRVTVAQGTELIEAQYTTDRRYKDAEIFYSHGDLGTGILANRSFEHWTGATLDNWTEHDEEGAGGDAPDSGSIYSKVTGTYEATSGETRGTARDNYAVKIGVVDNGSTTELASAKALVGIRQDSTGDVTASQGCVVTFTAQVVTDGTAGATTTRNHPFYCALWLDGDAGTDYYFDANPYSSTVNTWVSGDMASPPAASKVALYNPLTARKIRTGIDAHVDGTVTFPDAGKLRVILYNIVDVGGGTTPTGVIYDDVVVTLTGGDDSERGTTRGHSTADGATYGATLSLGTYFLGTGPTASHPQRITRNSGSYATSWSSSGGAEATTLSQLHAERAIMALGDSVERLQMEFQKASGTYWPHQGMYFDSTEYTCQSLRYEARDDVYSGEWVATGVGAGSTTTGGDTLDGFLLPHDVNDPFTLLGAGSGTGSGGSGDPGTGHDDPPGGGGGGGGSGGYGGADGHIPILQRIGTTVVASRANTIAQAVAALSSTGGTVHIPQGTYTITSPIAIPSNVTIEGDGWGTIIDVNTGNDSYAFYTQKAGEGKRDTSTNISNVTIRNLTLQGRNDTLYFHEHTHLLNLNGASDVLIENVQFKNWRGDAIYLGSGNVGYIKYTSTGSGQTLTTATAHNFEDGDEVVIWSTDATRGLSSNVVMVDSTETVPTGLASKTPYYIVNKTSTTFELEASVGGGAITLSGTGTASSGTSGNYVGLQRHNERVTIRNCHFDGGSTDKEHRAMQTAATVTASASTDKITHTGHSYAEGVAIRLNSTGSMPTGLVSGTTYYVRDLETNAYKLSATRAGAAINLTSDGSGTITIPADTVNQRQCISVVDGTAVKIYGNTFTNCGSASMPGVIDIEPDRAPYHIIDDISVTDNTMTDTGGNIGAICANLQHWGDFYQPPRNIKISGNVIRNSVPTGVLVQRSNEALLTDEPLGITIANNHVDTTTGISTGQTGRPFVLSGVSGAVVSGNHFQHTQGAATVGGNATATGDRECLDIMIVNNTFFQCGQIPYASDTGAYDDLYNCGLYIGFVDRLNILGNTFFDCGDEDTGDGECIEFAGGVGSTIIDGNHFVGNGRTDIIVKETGATLGTGTVTASAANDTLTYTAHPYLDGDRFRLATSAADLPAPLEVSTTYFVRDAATNTFKVAATLGGAAIDIVDAGTGTHTIRPVGWHHYGFNVVRGITGANEWADNAGVNRSMDDPQQTAYANDIVTKSNINTTSGVIIVQGNAVVAGQQATITAPSGATADTDNEARAKINDIRALLAAHGLMA